MDSEQVKEAKRVLAQEEAKLQELFAAREKQQKVIEGLQQRGKVNLVSASLDQLLSAGTQAEADNKEMTAAIAVIREIERRINLQKEEIRKAEVKTRIDEAQKLSIEAWQLEEEIAQELEPILKKFERVLEINQDIYRMIDRSRQMAFAANPFSRLDMALEQYEEHRKSYKKETALNLSGL